MVQLIYAAVCGMALAITVPADAGPKRSQSAKIEFKRAHPCPATGARKGPCKGWVIDHSLPLCAGGRDAAENMAWSTGAESKRKDQEEFALCRQIRKGLVKASSDKADLCLVAKQQRWPHLVAALCGYGRDGDPFVKQLKRDRT